MTTTGGTDVGRAARPLVLGPFEDSMGDTSFAALEALIAEFPQLLEPISVQRFEEVIRSEIERREREALHGTDR